MKGALWLAEHAWLTRSWRPRDLRNLWKRGTGDGVQRAEAPTDRERIAEAVRWLSRAQDVTGDGGVAGRYILGRGWTSSHPETTGSLVPTFLRLAKETRDRSLEERAGRGVEFLQAVQHESGAFRGGEVAERERGLSAFTTAQILHGLTTWYRATGDPETLDAAHRAAGWLVSMQDPDGAWRRHTDRDLTVTFSAHVSCWLAEFGTELGDRAALGAAGRNLEWVLRHQDAESGWFDGASLPVHEHEKRSAHTHTIGYVLRGVLQTSELLRHREGIAAVRFAGVRLAHATRTRRAVAGELDHRWRPRARYVCLSGNAQLARVWLRLHEMHPDPVLLEAADVALDAVRRAQRMLDPDEDLRGSIPGSDPLWGDYIRNGYPSWAAMFFIDALLARNRIRRTSSPPVLHAATL